MTLFFYERKMHKIGNAWRIWAKALGAKEGKNDREADIIASIRTLILMCTWLLMWLSWPMQYDIGMM